ncbi:MAG: PepSY domain-containing protein [Candidatus Neomarinimicrobiota bacterium]|nr:MAG: PepSY domain-containing protein [Candidatus Neomarinimicrobiota bacterium]
MTSLHSWRKWHRFVLGYFRWLTVISSLFIVLISITGLALEHKSDLRFLQTGRIPASWLPSTYRVRLASLRAAQKDPQEEEAAIPLSWVVYDLHSGAFFGVSGRIYYDLVAVALVILSGTGIWIFLVTSKQRRLK